MRLTAYRYFIALLAITSASCAYLRSPFEGPADSAVEVEAAARAHDAAVEQASALSRDNTIEVIGRDQPALTLEDRILALVNQERNRAGMGPLSFSPQLTNAARQHSATMAAQGFFEHRGEGEPDLFERVTASGLDTDHVGENIFQSSESRGSVADDCVQMWLRSPGHRRNMLSPDFAKTGIAVGKSVDWESYITEDFAH
jgi:uncharacterized protein YkwD